MSDSDPSQTSILYVSHLVTPGTLWNYFQIRRAVGDEYDIYWVYEGSSARRWLSRLPIEAFDLTDDLLESWRPLMNGNGIVPGNGHIPTIAFAHRHKYDYYWFIEYDIRYTGDWWSVFDLSRDSEADLIGPVVEAPFSDESWDHWESINLPYSELARSFAPVRRVSHRLLEHVTDVITSGYWAHHETLLPSACWNEDWPMVDLNELAMNQRGAPLYSTASDADAPSTLDYRPVTSTTCHAKRDRLYHPVKPLKWFLDKFGIRRGLIEAIRARHRIQ